MGTIKVSKAKQVMVRIGVLNVGGLGEKATMKSIQCSEAKLVLAKVKTLEEHSISIKRDMSKTALEDGNYDIVLPILISETEEILEGEVYYDGEGNFRVAGTGNIISLSAVKLLAKPEHFTSKQLQDIVDGKLKDGDKVMVECKQTTSSLNKLNLKQWEYVIKQPLTLHKAEESYASSPTKGAKEITDDLIQDIYDRCDQDQITKSDFYLSGFDDGLKYREEANTLTDEEIEKESELENTNDDVGSISAAFERGAKWAKSRLSEPIWYVVNGTTSPSKRKIKKGICIKCGEPLTIKDSTGYHSECAEQIKGSNHQ